MSSFQSEFNIFQSAVRVRFGPGVRYEAGSEIRRLGCERAVILSTPGQRALAEETFRDVGAAAAGFLPLAHMHTPVEVTEMALIDVQRLQADCLVAIGGGSTIGLSKALSLRTGLPQIVLPTTYSGSESTSVLGQTADGRKFTMSDVRVQPQTILYDAELVRSLPIPISVASGLNAMAHAIEGLYARDRNPLSTLFALEGLRALVEGLPMVCEHPESLESRGKTLYGAWLCGTVLGQVGMALHHKVCHVLGGSFNLPHAETHSVMLPYTTTFNALAAQTLLEPVREIFGADDLGVSIATFAYALGAPRSLKEIGMREEDLETAADLAMMNSYWNPRTLVHSEILELLRGAWAGELGR